MIIRNQRAFVVGAAFVVFAAIYFAMSLAYAPGTTARMGPGYFPRLLAVLLGGLGLVILLGSLRRSAPHERLAPWDWRALVWITGSVLVFAVLLPLAGLVVALSVMLLLAMRASPGFSWPAALVTTAVLVAGAVGAFVIGLGLQMRLGPPVSVLQALGLMN